MTAILTFEIPDEFIDRRSVRSEVRTQFRKIGEKWHREHRKRHFTPYGARLYKYEPRKRWYNIRKLKAFGHMLPLVKTGVSRRLSENKRIAVTNSGTTERPVYGVAITMPVRVFNFRPKGSNINMRREFSTIAQVELEEYSQTAAQAIEQRIARTRPRRTRKIK